MKRVLFISAATLVGLVLLIGGGAAYLLMGSNDRGMSRDGRLAPPASVRNAQEAPKFDSAKPAAPAKTADQPPEVQLPTEFRLPTELDIPTPKVPDDLARPASEAKS
jgi:hypothetical protein